MFATESIVCLPFPSFPLSTFSPARDAVSESFSLGPLRFRRRKLGNQSRKGHRSRAMFFQSQGQGEENRVPNARVAFPKVTRFFPGLSLVFPASHLVSKVMVSLQEQTKFIMLMLPSLTAQRNVAVLPAHARVERVAPGDGLGAPGVAAEVGGRRHLWEDALGNGLRVRIGGEPPLALEAVFGHVPLALIEPAVSFDAAR